MNVNELLLGKNTYKIVEIKAHYVDSEYGIINGGEMISYRFASPWLALNSENYMKYKHSSIKERRELLRKIFIGNILSMSKHLKYNVPTTIEVDLELYPLKVSFKDISMIGFKGIFETNFLVPDYMGIGKAVSHGFGIVKKLLRCNVEGSNI